MEWRIAYIGGSPAVELAAGELKKYIPLIDTKASAALLKVDRYRETLEGVLWVGLDEAFANKVPRVDDPQLDDAIYVRVEDRAGIVTGSNARSVLIAAYRLLREAGVRWIRPGADGERVVARSLEGFSLDIAEKAQKRHRGICIEGAISYDHARNLIEWMPKVGMNAYFNQFMVPVMFFERWYFHEKNPYMEAQPISVGEAEAMTDSLIAEIKRRDMMLHAVGHGWTCIPFGLEANSWNIKQDYVDEETTGCLAMIGGKRFLRRGIAIYTNLCYSNPQVRARVAQAVADYAQSHDDVDYLHVWLADNGNNHCECPDCRQARPSDFYVMMLNEIDSLLQQKGLATRIVFLLYVDLLWPPQRERFRNPGRFVLLFAPISRTYSASFLSAAGERAQMAPYVRNELEMPKRVDENLAHLRAWQELFAGDGFDFDYHLMGDNYHDPGEFLCAAVLFEDMESLDRIGLSGMISCQVQRAFFPTGLSMVAMARALWGGSTFETTARDHMADVFGQDADELYEYLKELSELFDPPYLRGEKPLISDESARRYNRIPGHIARMEPLFERRGKEAETLADRTTWLYMARHAQLCRLLAQALAQKAAGDQQAAEDAWRLAKDYAFRIEREVGNALDVYIFTSVLEGAIVRQQE